MSIYWLPAYSAVRLRLYCTAVFVLTWDFHLWRWTALHVTGREAGKVVKLWQEPSVFLSFAASSASWTGFFQASGYENKEWICSCQVKKRFCFWTSGSLFLAFYKLIIKTLIRIKQWKQGEGKKLYTYCKVVPAAKILYIGFRATVNFQNFKVALNSKYTQIFFKTLPKVASYNFHPSTIFELQAPKAVIRGVFSRSCCCYGNLLCHENDNNMFTNDWAIFWDQLIVASSDKEQL